MSSPEAGLAASPGAPRQERRPRGRRSRLLAILLVVAVVAGIVAVVLHGVGSASNPSPGANATVPANWLGYRDPEGLFGVRLPRDWAVSIETDNETIADRTCSSTEPTEFVGLRNLSQGNGSAQVGISAHLINTETACDHHLYCGGSWSARQTGSFNGIPATHDEPAVWYFETGNAQFRVSFTIPGVIGPSHSGGFPGVLPTPTPLPRNWVSADRTIVNQILASFQPSDPNALAC